MIKLIIASLLLISANTQVPAAKEVTTVPKITPTGLRPTLSIEQWCAVVGAIAAVTALFATARQISKNTKATNAQTLGGLYDRLIYINHTLIENWKIAQRLKTPFVAETDSYSPTSLYIDTVKNLFHEIYAYHKSGLVEEAEWHSWREVLKEFCNEPFFRGYWEHKHVAYSSGLHNLIDDLIKEHTLENAKGVAQLNKP